MPIMERQKPSAWERVRSMMSAASGVAALAIAMIAGTIAGVREVTVIEERQAENTDARVKLLAEIGALSSEIDQIKGETGQHYKEDEQKLARVASLEARVSALEAQAATLLKGHDENAKRLEDLRADLGVRQTDIKGACDVLRQRLDSLSDKLNGDLKR